MTGKLCLNKMEVDEVSMSNPDHTSRFSGADELGAFIESHRRQLLAYVVPAAAPVDDHFWQHIMTATQAAAEAVCAGVSAAGCSTVCLCAR